MSYKEEFVWNVPSLGVWSALGGVEVKGIEEEECDTYCYCLSETFISEGKKHRVKVHYTPNGEGYVVIAGCKLYFRDCMRV